MKKNTQALLDLDLVDETWKSYLEKIPSWAGKALRSGEFEVLFRIFRIFFRTFLEFLDLILHPFKVGVTFAASDAEFGNKIAKDLEQAELKVTTDPAKMSDTRYLPLPSLLI